MLVSKQKNLCLSSIMNLLDIYREYADVKTNMLTCIKQLAWKVLKPDIIKLFQNSVWNSKS